TLQPMRRHGVDAAVIFADIMTPVVAMGVGVDLVEGVGPVIGEPIRSVRDVERLRVPEPREAVAPILAAIAIVRGQLPAEQVVAPWSARILASLAEAGVPTIHFGTGAATLLGPLARAGGDVIGLDWRIPLDEGWAVVGDRRGVQGNLDPAVLLGPWERVEAAT